MPFGLGKVLLAAGLSVAAVAPGAQAQTGGEAPRADAPYVSTAPLDCESFAALVDNALVEWQQAGETTFIVIARRGTGERSRGVVSARLRDVERYLAQRVSAAERRARLVTAEGGRVKGLGVLEIYVGGRLRVVIPTRKNAAEVCSGRVNPFL